MKENQPLPPPTLSEDVLQIVKEFGTIDDVGIYIQLRGKRISGDLVTQAHIQDTALKLSAEQDSPLKRIWKDDELFYEIRHQ